MIYVKIMGVTGDGFKERGRIVWDGKTMRPVSSESKYDHMMKSIVSDPIYAVPVGKGELTQKDGTKFLEGLRYFYKSPYLYATEPVEDVEKPTQEGLIDFAKNITHKALPGPAGRFNGVITDSLGRKYRFVNGHRVSWQTHDKHLESGGLSYEHHHIKNLSEEDATKYAKELEHKLKQMQKLVQDGRPNTNFRDIDAYSASGHYAKEMGIPKIEAERLLNALITAHKQKEEKTYSQPEDSEIEARYNPIGRGAVDLSSVANKSVYLLDHLKSEVKKEILGYKTGLHTREAELKLVPMRDIKPSQHGEDRINDSSKHSADSIKSGNLSKIAKADLAPIVLDKEGIIKDGNHRFSAAELNKQTHIYAWVPK